MTTMTTFIKRHPVLSYYALTFAISWVGFLLVVSPGGFSGTTEQFATLGLHAYLAVLAGPSIAGILMTGVVHGQAGYRELLARLLRWRVGARWYAVALLIAPLLIMATLGALSLTSPIFLPAILTTDDAVQLLLIGIAVGLFVPFFEELGWTGFAVPELRQRYSILGTGLIAGLLWGVWHFPLFMESASSAGVLPPALYLAVLLFSWLPPYRVLMVWVYDRTGSMLVAMLMHMTIVVGQFVLIPSSLSPMSIATFDLVLATALWIAVGAVALANHGHLSRQPLQPRVA